MSGLTAEQVISRLGLEPLPIEGGMWRQTYLDQDSSGIYFLIQPGDFSALHRLDITEVWHHYGGAPAEMLLLFPDGASEQTVLGDDLLAGQVPTLRVLPGVWMGASTQGEWSLLGTTMTPPFNPEGFELGDRELVHRYPKVADRIEELIR